ncbi:MAG: capsule assembly Wzi family protein [Dysgonamonadaceae bacterium]|jgi:hypothetical protein|nr:capsule assembly Wzi family protein [Dysgonamonadaceae bacterium]
MLLPDPFIKKILFVFVLFICHLNILAQDSLTYRMDVFASVATKDITPFWIVNNTYGTVPLHSNNVYGRGNIYWSHYFNKDFNIRSEIDLERASHHSSSFFIQQLYTSLSYKSLSLTIGAKEYYNSILYKNLSLGDFTYSPNARPIPEINLDVPEFVTVPYTKGILQAKGNFAVGKSTDSRYIERTVQHGKDYAKDILWHHKSLAIRLYDPKQHFPLSLIFGVVHAAQWGGWTSKDDLGKLPHSFHDFFRIITGKGGGDDASLGEQINVLGNHQGTYNLKFGYTNRDFDIAVYKQHYFDDPSGMEYANWRDGIWGAECALNNLTYLKKIVVEYFNTTNQSGTMHFLNHDRPNTRGGGNDDYYNHTNYINGWSHWGRALGNPLITSPEYNKDGELFFKNNRVKAIHLGFEGDISTALSYRFLITGMYSWGRMSYPFLERKDNLSSLLECSYIHPRLKDWKFSIQSAFDTGDLYDNNFGCSFKISKSGRIF